MPNVGAWLLAFVLGLGGPAASANAAAALPDAAPPDAAAAAPELTFVSVPGIPRNVVAGLAQDRDGWLWLGTGDGLARFDGYRLQKVERDGPDALARNMGWVRAMAAAPDGRLWIGTESSGLAVHEPDTRRIRLLGGPQPGTQPSIVAVALDGEGRVWMGTLGGGLLRFDERSARFETLALPGEAAGEGQAYALATSAEGGVWVGHRAGLARWRPGDTVLRPVPLPKHPEAPSRDPVLALLAADDDRLWLGTQRGHLAVVDADGQAAWLPAAGRGPVHALALAPDGPLWAGHRFGIDLVDTRNGALRQRLVHRANQPAGLAGNDVTAVLRDAAGAMWVAGYGIGLQRHRSSPAITVRGPESDRDGPLGTADVRALLALRDQRILAATSSGSVAVLDADLRVLGALPYRGPPIEAMAEDADGRRWLAARGRVLMTDDRGRVLREWEPDAGAALLLQCDPDGSVWLGAERGLLRWRPGEAGFTALRDLHGHKLEGEVFDLAADGEGGLWVGGRAGLHHLAAGEDVLRPVEAAPGHALGFPLVLGLLRDRRGTLWLDTPVAGLHRMIGRDASGRAMFERISVRHGVVGRPFGANLHEDARGRIWSQAFVYDPAADRLDELRAADGVQIGTPWFRSHARMADGRLLFGGSRGLMRVQTERFEPSRDQPPLVISSLRVNGLPHRPRSMREGLLLPPGTRSFGVEFAALDFADPELVRYRYRLLGYDPEWLPSDANFRSPSYSELPPGAYTFEVQATNRSGLWSPHTLRLPVVVQPHWWQTRWALLSLATLAGFAVWGLVRSRTAQLRRRQDTLERMVLARTAELRQVSQTDALTGLRNRRYLAQRIDEDLKLVQRQHAKATGRDDVDLLVFLIDLDHFKAINDGHGHAAGDAVLVQTAEALRRVFRDTDTLVRWGGEEFLVVARATERKHAGELAERLRREIAGLPALLPGPLAGALAVTASIGVVAYPPDPGHPDGWRWGAVLQLADAALYAAKHRGRNGWIAVLASPSHVAAEGGAGDWIAHPETVIEYAARHAGGE